MKNTLILLVLFLLLAGSTFYFFNYKPKKSSVKRLDMNFHVDNMDDIHKIFLADRTGRQVTLEKNGNHWIYNGKIKARPSAVNNLLDAIKRVRMKYIPPQAAVPHAVKNLAASGIKVELYNKNNEPIKVYYVGGMTSDERGTYMIMDNSEQPYVMHIPSWEGGLRARYWLKDMDWEDRSVFDYQPHEIKSIWVEYPRQKSKSFKLEKVNNAFEIAPFYEVTPKITKPAANGRIQQYLIGFQSLVAEGFRNDAPYRDSINQMIPFCTIQITNQKNKVNKVQFYPKDPGATTSRKPTTRSDIFRYYASDNNGNFMLVQQRVFKDIFWSYESFFE